MESIDLKRITALTNDIEKLQEFIDALNNQRDHKIKALYIVNENNYQIELKGNFSVDASQKLLDLIISSRKSLIDKLQKILFECIEVSQSD